jgi:hypothetical protein
MNRDFLVCEILKALEGRNVGILLHSMDETVEDEEKENARGEIF